MSIYPNSFLIKIIIALLSLFTISCCGNDSSELFKINKLNLVWTKAQHSLGPSKLKDLKNDLLRHETDELNLKKLKAHSQDKDGLFEATVRKKLLIILKKYSLDRYYNDIHPRKDQLSGESISRDEISTNFRDSKLDKLWKKAEKLGLNQEQLMMLHEEFEHQQSKLDDHYRMMTEINDRLDDQRRDTAENLIDSNIDEKPRKSNVDLRETPTEKKARLDLNLHQGLKDKHEDIKKGFKELHEKVSTGKSSKDKPFEEEIINSLWSKALEMNFTRSELDSLKEELEHFQVRLQKLKHFELELERHQLISKNSKSYLEDDDETKHLKRRIQDLTKKVEKAHFSIESILNKHSDEL